MDGVGGKMFEVGWWNGEWGGGWGSLRNLSYNYLNRGQGRNCSYGE